MTAIGAATHSQTPRSVAAWFGYTLVAGMAAGLLVHAIGWAAALDRLIRSGSLSVPPVQSAIALALGLVAIRAASSGSRRTRQTATGVVLALLLAGFIAAPLPLQVNGRSYMGDGTDFATDRRDFDEHFPYARGELQFKSHLGDLVLVLLDRAFGASGSSSARAYATLSRLGGVLFVVELLVVVAWYRWRPRACRYIGLAIAAPVSLCFFGFFEVGYLALGVAVFPLLELSLKPRAAGRVTSRLVAGALQGFHSALHGFGLLGIAGLALASLSGRGALGARLVRTANLVAAAVAMYAGWVAVYVVVLHLAVVPDSAVSGFGGRALFDGAVFDKRIVDPLLSYNGLGEVGLASLLVGVPLFVLAAFRAPWQSLVRTAGYALPGVLFLVWWWPSLGVVPDVDLALAAFPGVFAALWLIARRTRSCWSGFLMLVGIHFVVWTAIGGAAFGRVWTE
jgi:hypothetical protein